MKSYPSYKDSGIEWIGEIPSHWESLRLKNLSTIQASNVDKKIKENEHEILLCNYLDVYRNEFISKKINFMKGTANEKEMKKFILEKDDVLVTKDSEDPKDIAIPAHVIEDFDNVLCGYHLTQIKPESSLSGRYLFRIFQTKAFNAYFEVNANGITRYGLTIQTFSNFKVLFPPLSEQTAIADFLDQKTGEIDLAVKKGEERIRLLKEYRAAMIHEAVTRGVPADIAGIDQGVEMKESGIEYIGEIPAHWEVKKLKYLSSIMTGDKNTEDKEKEGEYPFFVRSQTVENISTYSYDGEAILTAGDGVGVAKVFHYVNGKFDYHQRVYKISDFNDVLGKYVFFYMKSNFYNEVIKLSAKSTVDSLRMYMLKDFPVVFGSINEQRQIIEYIETETARIDAEIGAAEREIRLLKEYRQALISEAVTGKIDVRDYPLN